MKWFKEKDRDFGIEEQVSIREKINARRVSVHQQDARKALIEPRKTSAGELSLQLKMLQEKADEDADPASPETGSSYLVAHHGWIAARIVYLPTKGGKKKKT